MGQVSVSVRPSVQRIAILTGIFPPDIGGPATSVPDLARRLIEGGHAVSVVTLADRPGTDPADPFPVVRIPRSLAAPRRIGAVARAVARLEPDVVFANGLHLESSFIRRAPVVQKVVGDWAWERAVNRRLTDAGVNAFQTAGLPPRVRALRRLRSAVTCRASRVVVPSRYLAALVAGWGVDKRLIRVVPNAAPAPEQSPAALPPRIAFVGRLVRWKHVDHVLRVLSDLPDTSLDVIGDGPLDAELRELAAELGVGKRVRFHGVLSRERTWRHLRGDAGVLVLPSSYEGMPHVVLEAFAAGVPVVASDAGGTGELVSHGDSGLVYRCGDLPALRDALGRALEPATAARLIGGGASVARELTPEHTAAATVGVLEEVLPPARNSGG